MSRKERDDEIFWETRIGYELMLDEADPLDIQSRMELWFIFSTMWLVINDYSFDELSKTLKTQFEKHGEQLC